MDAKIRASDKDLPVWLTSMNNYPNSKSAIYHSIKLPFDAEVAEKFLSGI